MLSEISHSQNGLILYDFTYMRYLVKFIDSESRMGAGRSRYLVFDGRRVLFYKTRKLLRMDNGYGCVTM